MFKNKPRTKRYNSDLLVYEAFYVALRNSLIVAIAPLALIFFLIAVEFYPRPEKFLSMITTIGEIVFIISFFINFFYYVYFIKLRSRYAYLLTILISGVLTVAIFFTDLKIADIYQTAIVATWFVLLAVIILFNKIGGWPNKESQYDQESWLYRHELAESREEDTDHHDHGDPEDKYMHRYVEDPAHEEDEDLLQD